jgi:hypothetical protein
MIHEIAIELKAKLLARKCPIEVIDGPEATTTTTFGRERIVLERDGGDKFGPVRGTHVNKKHRMTRVQSAKITIYAQAVAVGAMQFEHERRAEHVLDLVLVALHEVLSLRRNAYAITGGKFIAPVNLSASEKPAGAVYELAFTVDRPVMEQTWAGAARPEATIGGEDGVTIRRSTVVVGAGDDETACGT